jgi:hypothetical protein
VEYLWDAAWAFHEEGDPNAEVWVQERLVDILLGNRRASRGWNPPQRDAAVD